MDKKNIQSIHFVGIKGVGMTPLAIIAKEAGMQVTGSDIADVFITDKALATAGIHVSIGFAPEHIQNADLVITTGAHNGFDNIEVVYAKEKNIPIWTQGRAVGAFMEGTIFNREQKGISITGTHGKTTTTAMVATILTDAKKDPSFLIGTSDVPSLGQSGHYGTGNYFIAEADEYVSEPMYEVVPKLLLQNPSIAIITNIEFDHPDVYRDVAHVRDIMQQFIEENVKENGKVIINGDDENAMILMRTLSMNGKRFLSFGKKDTNMYHIKNIDILPEKTMFSVDVVDHGIVSFTLRSSGEHNVYNATAAIIASLQAGLTIAEIQKGLLAFTGSKRRMEYKGVLASGALVYDEYAHHPTEIRRSLEALKAMYPNKKIVCLFQPHTFSRTKALFTSFLTAFEVADTVLLLPIYASLREKADISVSSEDLARQINLNDDKAVYLPKPIDVINYIEKNSFDSDTLFVTMGAGDVYKVIDEMKFE